MALKDLKSDLSKFRMPKKDPLENKKIDEVNKKSNQTPLSSMVDSAPKIPRSTTTTNKEGVNPQKMDNSSKFLGETTPSKLDNSSNFLGETTPNKADITSKFLGETTPQKVDNSSKFLGETTPTPSDKQSQFLGETAPNKADITSKFLGETNPNRFDNSSNFLGETTPTPANNESRFLGETTPTPANNQSQFLGETTPTPANNQSQFLGETTPSPANNESRFLGETTPSSKDSTGQFLGETTPSSTNNTGQFLGETTKDKITQGDKDKGETTPSDFTFTGKLENEGKDFKEVNYFSDIHALGFNSKFGGVESSKFIGVSPDNTVFDGTTSLYSNIDNSTFTLGKTYEQSFDSAGRLNSGETGFGIGKSQGERKSPSFLDLQYAKFNLKDDSFNTGLGLFRHPLILRGIQRKGISKGEPQSWGILGVTFDDGLIRGGAITSTVRAAIDTARIGAWMASVEGLLWGVKQLGLQQSNPNVETFGTGIRRTKIWTPINTLAATLGGFAGLHPNRHGVTPFDLNEGTYSEVLGKKVLTHIDDSTLSTGPTSNRLVNKWNKEFKQLPNGDVTDTGDGSKLLDKLKNAFSGGPNSLYGLGDFSPNQSTENTIPDTQPGELGRTYNQKKQYNSTDAGPKSSGVKGKVFEPDNTDLGLNANNLPGSFLNNKINTDGETHDIEKLTNSSEWIKNYETIAYGNIPDRIAGITANTYDFRNELSNDSPYKVIAKNENYGTNNIDTRVNFQNPSAGTIKDRTEWFKTAKNGERYDKVNASEVGDGDINDLVHLWFQAEGGSKVQFRGTAKGITETFSPSWDSIKYNGRADQAYKYTTFERSLSFNFQVYATSRIEMKPIWTKLQYLSTMTMPQYGEANGYQGTLVRFRLGSLYNRKLAFIESLSYNMSDETPWEISMLGSNEPIGELPMGIDVSIGLKILGDVRPQLGTTGIYSWGTDRNGEF
jgi:hypothetical protein